MRCYPRVGCQSITHVLRVDPVLRHIRVGNDHHKVVIAFVPRNPLDGHLCRCQCVVPRAARRGPVQSLDHVELRHVGAGRVAEGDQLDARGLAVVRDDGVVVLVAVRGKGFHDEHRNCCTSRQPSVLRVELRHRCTRIKGKEQPLGFTLGSAGGRLVETPPLVHSPLSCSTVNQSRVVKVPHSLQLHPHPLFLLRLNRFKQPPELTDFQAHSLLQPIVGTGIQVSHIGLFVPSPNSSRGCGCGGLFSRFSSNLCCQGIIGVGDGFRLRGRWRLHAELLVQHHTAVPGPRPAVALATSGPSPRP
eukprot:Sspe_Gene.26582::Locus_11111_Transcript_1_1_Confidence_1.000_Length_1221::g.26582::m.26582